MRWHIIQRITLRIFSLGKFRFTQHLDELIECTIHGNVTEMFSMNYVIDKYNMYTKRHSRQRFVNILFFFNISENR